MISPDTEKELEERLRDVFPDVAQPQMLRVLAVVEQTVSRELHSGPLPSPLQLAAYNETIPDAAERIFKMAELEQGHRHILDHRIVEANISSNKIDLLLGFIMSLLLIAGAFYLRTNGQQWVSAAFLATGSVSMVSAFIKR